MTKKDYIKIAEVLSDHFEDVNLRDDDTINDEETGLLNDFINLFEEDNGNFDAKIFIKHIQNHSDCNISQKYIVKT